MSRKGVFTAVIAILCCSTVSAVHGAPENPRRPRKITLNIPRTTLADAVSAVVREANIIVVEDKDFDAQRIVGPLKGVYTVDLAMAILLADSGAEFTRTGSLILIDGSVARAKGH